MGAQGARAGARSARSSAEQWSLLVAGEGDESRYRELGASLGVADAVHWLGVVPEVERVYDAADALVAPSSYETFSLVTFEAAASGLPIVATPVNGVRELIEEGATACSSSATRRRSPPASIGWPPIPSCGCASGTPLASRPWCIGRERMVREHHELYERLASRAESRSSPTTGARRDPPSDPGRAGPGRPSIV